MQLSCVFYPDSLYILHTGTSTVDSFTQCHLSSNRRRVIRFQNQKMKSALFQSMNRPGRQIPRSPDYDQITFFHRIFLSFSLFSLKNNVHINITLHYSFLFVNSVNVHFFRSVFLKYVTFYNISDVILCSIHRFCSYRSHIFLLVYFSRNIFRLFLEIFHKSFFSALV